MNAGNTLVHLNGSDFSSHLIYQILMIINFPTNTLGSAYVPPPHLKIKYLHCLYVGNESCHTPCLLILGKLSTPPPPPPLYILMLEPPLLIHVGVRIFIHCFMCGGQTPCFRDDSSHITYVSHVAEANLAGPAFISDCWMLHPHPG